MSDIEMCGEAVLIDRNGQALSLSSPVFLRGRIGELLPKLAFEIQGPCEIHGVRIRMQRIRTWESVTQLIEYDYRGRPIRLVAAADDEVIVPRPHTEK